MSEETASAQVTITNHMPGSVSLKIQNQLMPGLQMKLDHTELKAGETAQMAFQLISKEQHPTGPLTALILVEPVHSVIPVVVMFK